MISFPLEKGVGLSWGTSFPGHNEKGELFRDFPVYGRDGCQFINREKRAVFFPEFQNFSCHQLIDKRDFQQLLPSCFVDIDPIFMEELQFLEPCCQFFLLLFQFPGQRFQQFFQGVVSCSGLLGLHATGEQEAQDHQ